MFDEVLELLKDTLNGAFSRDTERKRIRKIIFWYDSKCEQDSKKKRRTFYIIYKVYGRFKSHN